MIIALVAVSGLHGSERGQMVSAKDEKALTKSFEDCVNSRSYAFNNCKRPVVVCCLKETNNKETIHCLTQKVIDKECQSIDGNFARITKVHWYPATEKVTKIKNVESDQWIDQNDTKRVMLCTVYNIGSNTEKEDILNVNQLLVSHPRIPMLVIVTSSDLKSICEAVEADMTSFNVDFSAAILQSAKELAISKLDNIVNSGDSIDELLKKLEELSCQSKVFQSKNDEKKLVDSLSAFYSFTKFFTNHWGKLAGVSLIGILACYYKVTH